MIHLQPEVNVFFQSFDEIDMSNMLTILSYDSRPVQTLLSEKNRHLFNSKYPLFYNYKHTNHNGDVKYQSAIDIALEANQIHSVALIIDYIVRYQNKWIFSFLFRNNFIKLINRGIPLSNLLQSNVFQHQYENILWPEIHTDS